MLASEKTSGVTRIFHQAQLPYTDPIRTESEGRAVGAPGDFHVKGPWQILAKEMGIIKTESIRKLSNF